MTGPEMFYTRERSILRMFYLWDFMQNEISVTSKMFYFMVPPVATSSLLERLKIELPVKFYFGPRHRYAHFV